MSSSPLRRVVRTSFLYACLILCATASAHAAGGGDDCASPEAITGFITVPFTLVSATNSPELVVEAPCFDQIARDVWFNWTAPATAWVRVNRTHSTTLPLYVRIYDGPNCPAAGSILNCVFGDFFATAGSVYSVRVGVNAAHAAQTGTLTFLKLTPPEDSCATPKPFVNGLANTSPFWALTGTEGQDQPNCPGPVGAAITQDLWFTWTATFSGPAVLEGCVSGAAPGNRKAAIYLGSACPTVPPIACDDDSCGGREARVSFTAVTGQNYIVQVGRSPADTTLDSIAGWYRISPFTPPVANDECATALVLSGPGTINFDIAAATTSPEGQNCGPMARDLWYLFVATSTGQATFGSCSSGPDALISVYVGASCPPGALITCADEGCGTFGPAVVDFPVQCGQAYMLRFGSYDDPLGWTSGTLSLSVTGPTCSPFTSFCTGDSAAACPCGNAGSTGRGCSTSFSNQGGLIYGIGTASLTNDSVSVHVAGVSASLNTLLQGTAQEGGGAGIVFGDGRLCAGGTLTRLVQRIANGGQLDYPQPGDPALSVLGMVPAASTRVYQAWYRDSDLGFCMPGTFNLTNGLEVSWTP